MQDRVIALEGIHNFRDYGGYAVSGGGRLKQRLLWRSGQHYHATRDDLAQVAALGLATVIDLRGNSEREANPCPRPDRFAAEILFADGETSSDEGEAPHQALARGVVTANDAHDRMEAFYRILAWRPKLVEIYRLYFDRLATTSGPSLLHCFAGKDRTGLAAALVHDLMGVHADDMMEDYLLTNVAGNMERRIAAGAVVVRSNFGRSMDDDAVRMLMSAQPTFLDAALTSIRARHGSTETYAEEVLGVTPAKLDAIRANLVE